MNIFWEVHSNLTQEGPGDSESTRKALHLVGNLSEKPSILDIGCGPGRQTVVLAKETGGAIVALDTHQPFLDDVLKHAKNKNVSEHITTVNQSMDDMKFDKQSFDLIWSEGAIYIIGFEKGLKKWRKFLKPGGYLVASDITWLIDNPQGEIKKYWDDNYPDIMGQKEHVDIIEKSGYTLIDKFVLPESAWMDNYYTPIEKKIPALRKKYEGDKKANEFLDASQEEIDIFRKYSATYGYVFYIMRLP